MTGARKYQSNIMPILIKTGKAKNSWRLFYQLEVALSYQGSVENTFHELEFMYEMAKQDEHRKTALGGGYWGMQRKC